MCRVTHFCSAFFCQFSKYTHSRRTKKGTCLFIIIPTAGVAGRQASSTSIILKSFQVQVTQEVESTAHVQVVLFDVPSKKNKKCDPFL